MFLLLLACAAPKTDDPGFGGGSSDTAADSGTGGGTDGGDLIYSAVCQHDLPSEILDASGTFAITGVDGAPGPMPVGAAVDNTGGLEIVACVPDLTDDDPILDALVFSLRLSLFDHDDAPLDLGIGPDATGVNGLSGTVTDWGDVVSWDEGDTFLHFEGGLGSFSEIDKDGGRLVGAVDVTETDPPGYGMQIDIDLTW